MDSDLTRPLAQISVSEDDSPTRGALEGFLRGRLRLLGIVQSNRGLLLYIRREPVIASVVVLASERRMVAALAAAASQKQLAFELGVSLSTLNARLRKLLRKLNLRRPEQLVLLTNALADVSERQLVAKGRLLDANSAPVSTRIKQNAEFAVHVSLDAHALAQLTTAELAVTLLVLEGHSTLRIAGLRSTSPRTVANQLAAVFSKLAVRGRLELACRMLQPGCRDTKRRSA